MLTSALVPPRRGKRLLPAAESVAGQIIALKEEEGGGAAYKTVMMSFEEFRLGVITAIELHLLLEDVLTAHPGQGPLSAAASYYRACSGACDGCC